MSTYFRIQSKQNIIPTKKINTNLPQKQREECS